jgi:hypothetical protein
MIVRIKYRRIYKYSLIQGVKTGRICTQDFVSVNKMEKIKPIFKAKNIVYKIFDGRLTTSVRRAQMPDKQHPVTFIHPGVCLTTGP